MVDYTSNTCTDFITNKLPRLIPVLNEVFAPALFFEEANYGQAAVRQLVNMLFHTKPSLSSLEA